MTATKQEGLDPESGQITSQERMSKWLSKFFEKVEILKTNPELGKVAPKINLCRGVTPYHTL